MSREARASPPSKKQPQAVSDRGRARSEQLDEIAIHLGVLSRNERGTAFPQPEHHHLHTRRRHKIASIEFVHNRHVEPGKRNYRVGVKRQNLSGLRRDQRESRLN